jgi:hypothetical protein
VAVVCFVVPLEFDGLGAGEIEGRPEVERFILVTSAGFVEMLMFPG